MQPKSPPKSTPFNLFVAKASVPRLQDPFKSASVDSRGTKYSDTVWSANWAKTQRVVVEGPNVGHAASSLTAAGSSSASSLTAAGGSDRAAADQRTSAPVSTDLVSPSVKDCWYTSNDWRTQDTGFHAWLNKSDPPVAASDQQPHGSRPETQFGIFGPIPPPVASSPKAAGDKSAGFHKRPCA